MVDLYFEDFAVGLTLPSATCVVSRQDALAFAAEFDPQLCHLDEAEGDASLLGGLSASGWHTASLGMRLIFDAYVHRTASMGAPGIERLKWQRPVRPGDQLTVTSRVVGARRSKSRPEMGLVSLESQLCNQHDECVMKQDNILLVACRPPAPPLEDANHSLEAGQGSMQ